MSKGKILIVEDEAIIAGDLQMSLMNLGYEAILASRGDDAVSAAELERPDLVLMDIVLPGGMDGIEAAEVIHSRFGLPIVFLTAHSDDKMLERAKITEPFGYMIKPFEERELTVTIEIALYKHRTEQKLKRFADTLERRVAERTEKLERSNRDLEEFAYVASHDLQEPLRMITGYLQLISKRYRGKMDKDADEFIDYAVDGAKRMNGMINDLLSYSRVKRKGRPLKSTRCSEVIQKVLSNLSLTIRESGAEITSDALPTVRADETQLAQVFQNLISNAIKFRDERPLKIHIGVEEQDEEWVFSVSDNGIGIEPQYRERIFAIFQRLHGTGKYPGTGIGLAVCKRIVERHGGRIWAESDYGKGATFYFTIPAGDVTI